MLPHVDAEPVRQQNIFDDYHFLDKALHELSKQIKVDKHEVITKIELEKQFKIHCLFIFISLSILTLLFISLFLV